jgi:hypothetical protein
MTRRDGSPAAGFSSLRDFRHGSACARCRRASSPARKPIVQSGACISLLASQSRNAGDSGSKRRYLPRAMCGKSSGPAFACAYKSGRPARRRNPRVRNRSPQCCDNSPDRVREADSHEDKARELAHFFALLADSSYCQDKTTERIFERKKATLEAECERLRREYRIALIDYEREQLGRRDAA